MPGRPEINKQRLHDLLRQMLDIYSPSGKEEELTDFLYDYLRGFGLPVHRQEVDEDRTNLLVGSVASARVPLGFLGHIDTVPAFELEQYEFSEESGVVSGLGAADMKGGCAAMIEGLIAHKEAGLETSLMLALVVGEEENGDGTRRLLEDYTFERMIVGEPTDLMACTAHYGYLEMSLQTRGRRRHASMAGQDHHAIFAMLRTLMQISGYIGREGRELIFNIRDLQSSASGFAVPDQCAAWLDFHLPPETDPAFLAGELSRLVSAEQRSPASDRLEWEFPTSDRGYVLAEEGCLPRAMRRVMEAAGLPWNTGAFRSHSDANQLFQAGTEPLIFGPGQLARAHSPDESIAFAQVVDASGIYAALAAEQSTVP